MNAPFRPRVTDQVDFLRLLKVAEVARLTSLHRATIYRMIHEGTFPRQIRLTKRCVRWRASDIEHWLETREQA